MDAAHAAALDLLRLRTSSPLFRLGSAAAIQDKVSFLDAEPGVIAMLVDDTVGTDADPDRDGVLVVFNATPSADHGRGDRRRAGPCTTCRPPAATRSSRAPRSPRTR